MIPDPRKAYINLTFAYCTSRKEPRLQWYLDSLKREMNSVGRNSLTNPIIVITPHTDSVLQGITMPEGFAVKVHAPKPCVWQGPHRLTKEDWFAAGNARNTAICLAPDGWICFTDDLSVLTSGWLKAVFEALTFENTITCGAYEKVKKLLVVKGSIEAFEDFPAGHDNRTKYLANKTPGAVYAECGGQWLYGCSLVAPVEAFLNINGWCEDLCGGLGFEDCLTGIALANAGYKFRYDTRMKTLESEEDHSVEALYKKTDKGESPNDKSHAALARAQGIARFDNGFNLRAIRADVLAGNPFPIPTEPTKDWYDGQPLGEM